MIHRIVLLGVPVPLAAPAIATNASSAGHYIPKAGDHLAYYETIALGSGTGDYYGYTEHTFINGTLTMNSIAPNDTVSASYANTLFWENVTGSSMRYPSSGSFEFSADTYLYVAGTDNQTGYTNPYVWFYMDNSLGVGSQFYVLNTGLSVVAAHYNYPLDTTAGAYVVTIFAEGNGSYLRNDVYGRLQATYNWKAYFDPSTGYIVGYLYTETDTNSSGDGFTIMDQLSVTSTSFALTAGSAPAAATSSGVSTLEIAVIGLVVIVIVLVVIYLALRSRRRPSLPAHSATGHVSFAPPPMAPPPMGPPPVGAPPPVHLIPSGQPPVQQIVIKETVKVNCRYCGALIDSTVTRCPFCGAART